MKNALNFLIMFKRFDNFFLNLHCCSSHDSLPSIAMVYVIGNLKQQCFQLFCSHSIAAPRLIQWLLVQCSFDRMPYKSLLMSVCRGKGVYTIVIKFVECPVDKSVPRRAYVRYRGQL